MGIKMVFQQLLRLWSHQIEGLLMFSRSLRGSTQHLTQWFEITNIEQQIAIRVV